MDEFAMNLSSFMMGLGSEMDSAELCYQKTLWPTRLIVNITIMLGFRIDLFIGAKENFQTTLVPTR